MTLQPLMKTGVSRSFFGLRLYDVRGDEPELAKQLRIEDREPEAVAGGGRGSGLKAQASPPSLHQTIGSSSSITSWRR